ncbi:MAG: (2Fe-2S)-binding protein [Acidobacteria bacterium]|nr:MAG: (2Fe-2S)-binding protein [Acidobacteriota bacterium]
MIAFILNNQDISTNLPTGQTVLDFVRYRQNLKGTKIGCREGDCGACTILVGELVGDEVKYRTMTSCLMPLANAAGKHIVTVEGINPEDGSLTPVQQAMVDENGTQCGFCTVGFVMSLTGFCIDDTAKTPEMAVSSIDGNICRCTGYKSIERAAKSVCRQLAVGGKQFVPKRFDKIGARLEALRVGPGQTRTANRRPVVGGGTDVYVQRPDELVDTDATHVFYDDALRGIRDTGDFIEIGASATVTDLLESPIMQSAFPDLYKHLKLVSSTPIRNMATLAGNFVNASPIGDMTVWFLALDTEIELSEPSASAGGQLRTLKLRDFYLGYKQLAKEPDEIITAVRFRKPGSEFYFNFEKVCKRTYLDIATVNTAISLHVETTPGEGWMPPVLSEPGAVAKGKLSKLDHFITNAHVSAGGVAPVPLYLKETSSFLIGRRINGETIEKANKIIQAEISPISDVRGTEVYKRLLLRQLFRAHFVEMFATELTEIAES